MTPTLFDDVPATEPEPPAPAPAETLAVSVLATARWQIHWGGLLHGNSGGIDGQVTKCRLSNGVIFYVRENLARDHFATSAGERMAMKRGEAAGGREVLEVCGPPAWWERLRQLVAGMDTRRRPVRANRQFTPDWAERQLLRRA